MILREEITDASKAESDRLYRVACVIARAEEVLGSSQAAERWLKEPLPALGFETPLSILDTDEGAQMVCDLLGRIEHGVFS
jgi:putative toxin-antitoxin system antitoxin component (TIGR02293 family)